MKPPVKGTEEVPVGGTGRTTNFENPTVTTNKEPVVEKKPTIKEEPKKEVPPTPPKEPPRRTYTPPATKERSLRQLAPVAAWFGGKKDDGGVKDLTTWTQNDDAAKRLQWFNVLSPTNDEIFGKIQSAGNDAAGQ